ncbi:MAG: hypothetical protein ACE5OY_06590 [Candidatus Bathyarchaeia archaeon]
MIASGIKKSKLAVLVLTAVGVFLMLLLHLLQLAIPLLVLGGLAYLLARHFRSPRSKELGEDTLKEPSLPKGRRVLRALFGLACLLPIFVPGFLMMGPMFLTMLVILVLVQQLYLLPALVLGFYLLLSKRERRRAELVLAIVPLVIGFLSVPQLFEYLLSAQELSADVFFLISSTTAIMAGLFVILDGARGSITLAKAARVIGVIGFGVLMTLNVYSSVILAPPSERGYSPLFPPQGESESTEGPTPSLEPHEEAPIRSEIISSTPTSITVATETYQVTLSPREIVIPQGGEGELILNFDQRLSRLGSGTGIKSPHHDAPFWKPKEPGEGWIKPFNATACKFTPKISEYAIPDTYSVVFFTDIDGVRAEIPFTIIVTASLEGRELPPLSFTVEPDEISVKPGGSATVTLEFNRERYGSGVSLGGDIDLLVNFSAGRKSATEWTCALQFKGDAPAGTYELVVTIEDEGREIMVPLKVIVE